MPKITQQHDNGNSEGSTATTGRQPPEYRKKTPNYKWNKDRKAYT